jgi:Leucine-rich repeat (LRR) protein
MADEENKRKKKRKSGKKKSSSRRSQNTEEETAGLVMTGEAEYVPDSDGGAVVVVEQEPFSGEDMSPAPVPEPEALTAEVGGDVEEGQQQNGFTEDGLAVAMAVDAGAEDDYVYAAIEYDPDAKPPLHRNRRFRVYTCLAIVLVVAAVAVTVIYVTMGAKGVNEQYTDINVNTLPTLEPTPSPLSDREQSGIIEQIEAGVLQRGAVFANMTVDDPRKMALEWILHYDELQLNSDDVNLYQRYILALLAFSLDSLAWYYCGNHRMVDANETLDFVQEDCDVLASTGLLESHKVWLSSTEECDWYGVKCSANDGVLRGLELMGNDLIGEIPPEISQLRFLQYIAFNGNCLYGTIPPEMGSMPNLLSLELQGNGLSGAIPEELNNADKLQLLNGAMQYQYPYQCAASDGRIVNTIFAKGNPENGYNWGLMGDTVGDNVNKWKSMKGLHLFDNSITGTLSPALGDLKYLVFLRVHNNAIQGMIPNEIVKLDKLRELYLYQNGIFGDFPPDIGLMEDLQDLRVHENEMWGYLPDTFWKLTKMKKLWLQDTLECEQDEADEWKCMRSRDKGFQGSISPEIGNWNKLSQLLLNNNPFTGVLPAELGLCKELSRLHVHQTFISGVVPGEICLLRDEELFDHTGQVGVFYADCRPNNMTEDPFISCQCCSDCCDHTSGVCVWDD